jgi:hypothetical protein
MCVYFKCVYFLSSNSPDKSGEDLCQEIEADISAEGGKDGLVTSEDTQIIFSNHLGQRELDKRRLVNLRTEKEKAAFYALIEKSKQTALAETKKKETGALFLKEFQVTQQLF